MFMGQDGYLQSCKDIIHTRQKIQDAIEAIPQLHVKGSPIGPSLAFGANEPLNVYDVNDKLTAKGWSLSPIQAPAGLQLSVTVPWIKSADQFIEDLRAAVQQLVDDPPKGNGFTAAIYGTAATVPDKSIVDDVAAGYIDLLYKP
jgi:sphinganine-1-phosphate aldolase